MSKNTMSAVSTAFQFASEKVRDNLIAYMRRENLELSESVQRQMLDIVQSSLEQSFVLTSDSISSTLSR